MPARQNLKGIWNVKNYIIYRVDSSGPVKSLALASVAELEVGACATEAK